jgi:tetratricopeptide (TPR) repeat protein
VGTTTAAGGASARAYIVLRAKPRAFRVRTRGVEGVETRMIGRKSELKRLMDALETVFEDRELQAVTVIGDAGLGKSRLLYEFHNKVELLPDVWRIFNGRASEASEASPYSLVRDLFFFRFEILDSDPPEVAREKLERGIVSLCGEGSDASMRAHFIGQLVGLDFSESRYLSGILDDVKQIRDRAFHYAAEFFSEVARNVPVIFLLDDLHWADDGSLDFMDHIMRACADAPLLVVTAARPALLERRAHWGEGLDAHTRLPLQPLSKRESRQLVEEIMRQAASVPHELRDMVVGRAEGNPFYVEELIKMLVDQRVILPGPEEWVVELGRLGEVQVPPTLAGVLQTRLDGLDAEERLVLQRAAVIGREFWDAAAEALGTEGPEATRRALARLRDKELVYRRESSSFAGASEYVFKHALLRDVTYETLLKRERRRLHRLAAGWLAAQSGLRADEYAATIAEHYERAEESALAAEWYGRAGRQARESYAADAAVRHYRKALALLPPERRGAAGGSVYALEWYEGLGVVLWRQARLGEAVEAYELMRSEAEALGDAAAEARAWNGLSLVEDAQGDARAALKSAQRAEQLARGAGESKVARAALITAMLRRGYASYRLGDAAAVVELAECALALSSAEDSQRDRARSLHLLGTGHQMLGDSARAQECKEQSLALMRELGDRQNSGATLNALGETARLRGDYEGAASLYGEALTIARQIGNRSQQLVYLGNLGGALVGLGDYATAEGHLREVISTAGAEHFALSEVYRFLAEALLGQGKTAEALDAARLALAWGLKTGNTEFIGGAWRALGLVASRLPEAVEVEGATYTTAACFVESMRLFAEAGMDAERARVIRDWAEFEQSRGDSEHAAAMRREAREIFDRLGMTIEAERTSAAE